MRFRPYGSLGLEPQQTLSVAPNMCSGSCGVLVADSFDIIEQDPDLHHIVPSTTAIAVGVGDSRQNSHAIFTSVSVSV